MINYVNNAFDKTLKPCDAQQFQSLTQSGLTGKLILAHRAGDPRAKAKLPAFTYMGVLDGEKYKNYYEQCEERGTKPLGSRRMEFMRPTGLLMLDFDHVNEQAAASPSMGRGIDCPVKLWEYIREKVTAMAATPPLGGGGREEGHSLALAHITPGGDGLRLVLRRTPGKTIQEDQQAWARVLELDACGIKFDDVCKDISRLSFAPMAKEILYFNPDLLFAPLPPAEDYPDGTLWGGEPLRAPLGNNVRRPRGPKATPPSQSDTHDSVAQSTVLPSLSTACHSGNPLKASLAMNRGGVGGANIDPLRFAMPCSAPLVPLEEGTVLSDSSSDDGAAMGQTQKHCPSETGGRAECSVNGTERRGYETDYNGIEYSEIVRRLEEQLGGRPEHGARNSFIFTMACNLRYICNDNPRWIASILPTYGEEPAKHRATVQSAVNRPMSREMPETMKRALRVAKMGAEDNAGHSPSGESRRELPPSLPEVLPEPVGLLVSRTPAKMRPAVAMAVFPPLAAHLYGTEFVYVDNRSYEATFMTLLMAELSSGKSAVNQPIEYIIADMRARDEVARGREREWREACSATPDSKEKPKRPDGLGIQVLTPDMTNAAFVQRLADAKGRFLYTVMDEVELLDALKVNGRAGSVSQILRLAFDCGMYGQERVGGSSVNEQVKVRWNWNASTTIQCGRNYFRNSLTDGTLSRLSLATIVRDELDWGREIPKYGTYGQPFADALRPYIDKLNACRGVIHSPEAMLWAEAMIDEQVSYAEHCDDRAYAQLSFRAVLMGFMRGMVLYVMNGMRWTDGIGEFAAWSVRYDMWCKMRFFGDLLHQDLEAEASAVQRNHTRNLLDLLPATFSRQMAQEMRTAQGRKPNPSDMLRQWLHRGFIRRGEDEMFYKLSK